MSEQLGLVDDVLPPAFTRRWQEMEREAVTPLRARFEVILVRTIAGRCSVIAKVNGKVRIALHRGSWAMCADVIWEASS